ncbi:MAG: TAT-variant-translocated molybdopterin oxidoreductase, partial [Planctomycetaceae bacterium]|nr:TAT-variant-translocated molybdopterin oxidoreductase [Planctomycetaceae bacterium]
MDKKYWRSLGELHSTPEFEEVLHREFPVAASEYPEGVSRRRWMQIMGASVALAGATGCHWEDEKISPSVSRPEGLIPGVPQKFATFMELGGQAESLLVTCYDGRPIKVEGNPDSP